MLEQEYQNGLLKIEQLENDKLQQARKEALAIIFQRAVQYQGRWLLPEIIEEFVRKKIVMILKAETKAELKEISRIPKPVYNGNGISQGSVYDTEEEELLLWSLASLASPLSNEAFDRYMELFCRILPEKAKTVFPDEYKKYAV